MDEFARQNDAEHLSETSKAKHRADLLALASSMSSSSITPSSSPVPSKAFWSKRAFVFASALAVVVLVVNLALSALPGRRAQTVAQLLVPSAQSAEAFALEPIQALPGGIDARAGWTLTTTVPASREAIEKAIRLDPPVPVRVEKAEKDSWRVIPEEGLAPNTVYKITLATALVASDQQIPYEYSWVNQTVGTFRAEAFTPGPGVSGVPVSSAIEITFSHDGFVEPTGFFRISPQVDGRFETRGRALVFLPNKPLAPGKVYTVTLKKGFGMANNPEMQLKEDLVYGFQTNTREAMNEGQSLEMSDLYLPVSSEVRPSAPIRIPVPESADQDYLINAGIYRVSADEAKQYMTLRQHPLGLFQWSSVQWGEVAALVEGKTPIMTRERLNRTIEQKEYSRTAVVELPGQGAGFYLISLVKSGDAGEPARRNWTLVQVSDLAFHVMADRDRVLVWVVNAALQQPVSGATVTIGDTRATTGVDGTATLAATLPTSPSSALTVNVAQDGQETFALLARNQLGVWYGPRPTDPYAGNRDTWAYLYTDRRVQRRDDTLNVFGIALDRATKRVPAGLQLRLVPSGYYFYKDYGYRAHTVVIDEQPVQADAAGRFQAAFSWKDRRMGGYEIQLVRNGSVISSSFFEIRGEAKPMNSIDVTFDRLYAYAGDTISGTIRTTYTDGTRLPNAEIEVAVRRSSTGERIYEQTLTTNERGEALFRTVTRGMVGCSFTQGWASGSCRNTDELIVTARLAAASEGEVVKEAAMTLLPSSALVFEDEDTTTHTNETDFPYFGGTGALVAQEGKRLSLAGKIVEATIRANAVEFSPKPRTTVLVETYKEVQERTQTGTYYDEIKKQVEPVYSYLRRLERVDTRTLTTDDRGVFTDTIAVDETASYQMIVTVADGRGRRTTVNAYASRPYAGNSSTGNPVQEPPRLELSYRDASMPTPAPLVMGEATLRLNESVDVQAVAKNLPENAVTKPLFITSTRGIQRVSYGDENFKIVMDEASVPMMSVYAIVYTKTQGFMVANTRFTINQADYKLAVDVRSDKNEYAPGEKAQFTARVLGADDKPVAGTKVALSLADKALEPLYAFTQTNVVADLYSLYTDGIEATISTHKQADMYMGAEGGGGGAGDILMNPRKSFKDQAAFLVGETNTNGEVTFDVTMPDNLTTWRIQAVALSADLRGGEALVTRAVRKSLAVDAVIPRIVAPGDKAELRLQSMTDDLANDADVEYAIDAPTLGLSAQVVRAKGRAAVHVPFTVTEAMRGEHVVRIGIRSGSRQDALETRIQVLEAEYTKTIWESAEVTGPEFVLPENRGDHSSVLFMSRARGALLVEAQNLFSSVNFGARAEGMAAARVAHALLKEWGGTEVFTEPKWSEYQDLGMKPLPQSSADLDTTLAVLYSQQAIGDRAAMQAYLQDIYDSAEATRERRLKAAVGLALLGQPTLDALRTAAQAPNLTWKEEAVLLRGLVAVGARDEARMILERWYQRLDERDGQAWIKVSDAPSDMVEATRIATYAAYALADGHREALQLYMTRNNHVLSYNPVLDAQTLALRIAQAPNEDVLLVYRLGETTEEVHLNKGSHWLTLGPDEWKQFAIVSVRGPVTAQWQRRVPGLVKNTEGMTLVRTYRPVNTGAIKEGDLVQVTLSPKFSSRDTHGCYEVRDRLPANLAPVLNWQFQQTWYPARQDDGSVSFITCSSYNDVVTYPARVTVAGTYTAPMPIVQHLEQPSLSAVGATSVFTAGRK